MAGVSIVDSSLWREPGFLRSWIARTVSTLGSRVTSTAIPLVAAITLDATPAQMAALVLAGQLPDILFSLMAGVWVDRVRRRPLLVACDLGRACVLCLIPMAMALDQLSFALLWGVTFICATFSLVFAIASVAILPSVVPQRRLVEANSKLYLSESIATLAGPGLAGLLIQAVTAPKAVLAHAGSLVTSARSLHGVAVTDQQPARRTTAEAIVTVWHDAREGVRELYRTPVLRALTISTGIIMIGHAAHMTVSILFITRELHFTPVTIGLLASVNGVGATMGSLIADRLAARVSSGRTIVISAAVQGVGAFALPLAAEVTHPLPMIMTSTAVAGCVLSVGYVNQLSLRQRVTNTDVLGRVTAARRFVMFGMAPIGAGLGGLVGTWAGLQPTLMMGALIMCVGAVVMWLSPIRSVS